LNEEKPRATPEQGAQENILFRDSHAHILLVGMHRERENSHVMRIPDSLVRLRRGCEEII
jgi:hypothetical protein